MRLFFALFMISFWLIACVKKPEDKAKYLIKEELRKTLHDYKSYEPVEYGKLDSTFSTAENDPKYIAAVESFDDYSESAKNSLEKAKMYSSISYYPDAYYSHMKQARYNQQKLDSLIKQMESISNGFKKKFIGWNIKHSYRAKNLAGNLGIDHYMFYFNRSLDSLKKTVDISESAKESK